MDSIKNTTVFKKDKPVWWRCRNYGYFYEGPEAPDKCPACACPQNYYEVAAENY
ncbi:MAG: rubredoxin-like domain-containing protein [Syntrophomonas sp.]